MFPKFFKNKITIFFLIALVAFVAWWSEINTRHLTSSKQNLYYGFIYGIVALIGGLNGLLVSKSWGGLKSTLGKGLIFFSLGLVCLGCGQLVFSYYNIIVNRAIPYPSAADWFYFSIIIFYILGSFTLFKVSGSGLKLRSLKGKSLLVLLPVIALAFSWILLGRKLSVDFSTLHNAIVTWLSYSAPLGDAIYIAVVILTFLFSYKVLGGLLRRRIFFLLVALILEYLAEYTFVYQAANNTYYNGGIDDLIFTFSIIAMCLALNAFRIEKRLPSDDQSMEKAMQNGPA